MIVFLFSLGSFRARFGSSSARFCSSYLPITLSLLEFIIYKKYSFFCTNFFFISKKCTSSYFHNKRLMLLYKTQMSNLFSNQKRHYQSIAPYFTTLTQHNSQICWFEFKHIYLTVIYRAPKVEYIFTTHLIKNKPSFKIKHIIFFSYFMSNLLYWSNWQCKVINCNLFLSPKNCLLDQLP